MNGMFNEYLYLCKLVAYSFLRHLFRAICSLAPNPKSDWEHGVVPLMLQEVAQRPGNGWYWLLQLALLRTHFFQTIQTMLHALRVSLEKFGHTKKNQIFRLVKLLADLGTRLSSKFTR